MYKLHEDMTPWRARGTQHDQAFASSLVTSMVDNTAFSGWCVILYFIHSLELRHFDNGKGSVSHLRFDCVYNEDKFDRGWL